MHAYVVPATPATTIAVVYTSGGAGANTFNAWYFFYPPGAAVPATVQPASIINQELVSAANTAVTKTITPGSLQTVYVYYVSARCSAGTAQLTISIAGVNIWSTAATEVSTTTFRFQWIPSLAGINTGVANVGQSVVSITLSTCGAANIGTLDVQASVL